MSASVKDALDVASKGFHVFPLGQNTKLPLKGSKGFKDATRDPAIIKDMWGSKHFNLGVSTHTFGDGEALAAVDIDYHPDDAKPRNGFDVMHALEREGKNLPNTLTQRTPSGGAHFIYKTDEPLQGGAGVLGKEFGPGIDLRSAGGYVAMAPSDIGGRKYTISNNEAPTNVPKWIKEARPLIKPQLSLVIDSNTNQVQAIEFANELLKSLPVSSSGTRNHDAYLAAAKLKDLGLNFENTRDTMARYFKSEPLLGDRELEHVVSSAFKYGKNQPGSRNPGALFESLVGDLDVENDISIAEPAQMIKKKLIIQMAHECEIFKPPTDIVQGLISEKDLSFVYGLSGAGKSFVAIDMGLSIAFGREFLGRKTSKRPVLYVAAEAGASVRNRIWAWRQHFGLADVKADFALVPMSLDLCNGQDHAKQLIGAISDLKWKDGLLFIDTMSRSIGGGNENDGQDVGRFIHHLSEVSRHTGFGACVVHHAGKDQTKGLRGHSKLFNDSDTVLEVTNHKLIERKQKDRELGPAIGFTLKPVTIDSEFGPISSCVIEGGAAVDGFPEVPITPFASPDVDFAMSLLPDLFMNMARVAPADWGCKVGSRFINESDWRKAFFVEKYEDYGRTKKWQLWADMRGQMEWCDKYYYNEELKIVVKH